jgi:hypothetical protein
MQAAFDSPVRNPNHYPVSPSFPFLSCSYGTARTVSCATAGFPLEPVTSFAIVRWLIRKPLASLVQKRSPSPLVLMKRAPFWWPKAARLEIIWFYRHSGIWHPPTNFGKFQLPSTHGVSPIFWLADFGRAFELDNA